MSQLHMTFLTTEQALEMLPDGETIEVYRNLGPFAIGGEFPREAVTKAIHQFRCILPGDRAKELGYGICLMHPNGPAFIQSRPGVDFQQLSRSFAEQN